KTLASFEVQTYDLTEDKKNHHKIDFQFTDVFKDILSANSVSDIFKDLYNYELIPDSNDEASAFTYKGNTYSYINLDTILYKKKNEENNLSKSVISDVITYNQELNKIEGFNDKLRDVFSKVKVSRSEIEENIKSLNIWLSKKDGQP
ncbi:MAG: hypothetical protein ACRCZM_04800, partial [Bacteroidales bacterium]